MPSTWTGTNPCAEHTCQGACVNGQIDILCRQTRGQTHPLHEGPHRAFTDDVRQQPAYRRPTAMPERLRAVSEPASVGVLTYE
jgi:hypothetical protein